MGSSVSPVLTPQSGVPSKEGTSAVAEHLRSLAQQAAQEWSQLTAPVTGSSEEIAANFAARVAELAPQLPAPLDSMVVEPGQSVYYIPKSTPPFYECIHRVETSVSLSSGDDVFVLGFSIPCTDCLN